MGDGEDDEFADDVCPYCGDTLVPSDNHMHCRHLVVALGEIVHGPDEQYIDGELLKVASRQVSRLLKATFRISEVMLDLDEDDEQVFRSRAEKYCPNLETRPLLGFLAPESWGGHLRELIDSLVTGAPVPVKAVSAEVGSAPGACGSIETWYAEDAKRVIAHARARLNKLISAAVAIEAELRRFVEEVDARDQA